MWRAFLESANLPMRFAALPEEKTRVSKLKILNAHTSIGLSTVLMKAMAEKIRMIRIEVRSEDKASEIITTVFDAINGRKLGDQAESAARRLISCFEYYHKQRPLVVMNVEELIYYDDVKEASAIMNNLNLDVMIRALGDSDPPSLKISDLVLLRPLRTRN